MVAGVSLLVAAIGVLLLTTHSPVVLIVAVRLVFGITSGTGSADNQTAVYGQASATQVGTAAGLFRTFAYTPSPKVDDWADDDLGAVRTVGTRDH